MEFIQNIINKCLIFEKQPQKIGLSQFKEIEVKAKRTPPSIKNKNVKLSDLMRRI